MLCLLWVWTTTIEEICLCFVFVNDNLFSGVLQHTPQQRLLLRERYIGLMIWSRCPGNSVERLSLAAFREKIKSMHVLGVACTSSATGDLVVVWKGWIRKWCNEGQGIGAQMSIFMSLCSRVEYKAVAVWECGGCVLEMVRGSVRDGARGSGTVGKDSRERSWEENGVQRSLDISPSRIKLYISL